MRAADIIAAALAKLEPFTMGKKLYNPLTDEYDGVPAEELAFNGGQRSGKALMLIQEKAMAKEQRDRAAAMKARVDYEHTQQYYEQFYRQQGAMMQQQQQAQNSLAQLQGAYGNIGQRQSNNWGLGQYATDLTPVQRNVFERAPQSSFIEETKKTETPEAWLRRRVDETLWKGDQAA